MSRPCPRVIAVVAAIAWLGCRSETKPKVEDGIAQLAAALAESIRSGDETAFLRLHVQPNDMSPSGGYWLATKAGGTRPDAAWDEEVRASFRTLVDELRRREIAIDKLALKNVDGVMMGDVDGDRDRRNFDHLTLRLHDGRSDWLLTFAEGMQAKRGWVISGDLAVVVNELPERQQ